MADLTTRQDDFSAGAFRAGARHLIPSEGTYDVLNGLHDDDGSIYRRGGSGYVSNASFDTSHRWIWDGVLAGGQRTVVSGDTSLWVLAADDVTGINLGGTPTAPVAPAVLDGMLFLPDGQIYAGSRKVANHSTGTVAVTINSRTVTKAAGGFTASVDPGMLLRIGGAGRYYAVASVESDTSLTLVNPYEGATNAAAAFVFSRLGALSSHTGAGVVVASGVAVATAGTRLLVGSGRKLTMSNPINPDTGQLRTHLFTATDFHEFPAGAEIVAVGALRDRALVFTTGGVYLVSNLSLRIVDGSGQPQHRVELLSDDLVAWGQSGITSHRGTLVVPARDDIHLVDGLGAPVPVSGSLTPLYRAHVRAGRRPGGGAVYEGHYVLPILDPVSLDVEDVIVLRLDSPADTRLGTVFPYSRFDGHAGQVRALAPRQTAQGTELRAAGVDGRVLDVGVCWQPLAARKLDADASAFKWRVDTRDYGAAKAGNQGLVRFARLQYELVGAGADDPTIKCYASTGAPEGGVPLWGEVAWGAFTWGAAPPGSFALLAGQAPEDDGRKQFSWIVNQEGRYVRFRFETDDPCARLVLRAVGFDARVSRRVS